MSSCIIPCNIKPLFKKYRIQSVRDRGGENRPHTLLLKKTFRSFKLKDVWCLRNHFLIYLALCNVAFSSWSMGASAGNSIRTTGCTWFCKIASYSVAVMQSCRAIIRPNDPQKMAVPAITALLPCLTVGNRHCGLKASFIFPQNLKRVKDDSLEDIASSYCTGSKFTAGYVQCWEDDY